MITLLNIDPSMIANNLTSFEPTHPENLYAMSWKNVT